MGWSLGHSQEKKCNSPDTSSVRNKMPAGSPGEAQAACSHVGPTAAEVQELCVSRGRALAGASWALLGEVVILAGVAGSW